MNESCLDADQIETGWVTFSWAFYFFYPIQRA
jgi:hypothetical protein